MYHNEFVYNSDVNFDYTITTEHSNEFHLHCHNTYEVYYFISGDVSYLVEGKHYTPTPHSMLLLSSNVFHGVRINSDMPYERYALHFSKNVISGENLSLLLSSFSPKNSQSDIYYENANQYNLIKYFKNLLECQNLDEEIAAPITNIRIENLLSQILVMSHREKGYSEGYENHYIKNVISYLNEHISDNISLDFICEKFFISKCHLNTLFKRFTGTTVINYLIHKRVALAAQLLAQGIPACDCAERVGFHDYSVFFRAYKNIYGISPSNNPNQLI